MKMNHVFPAGDGKFIINDDIIVSNLEFNEDGVVYDIDYDENKVSEEDAKSASEDFIQKSIAGIVNNQGEETQQNGDLFVPKS